MSLTQLYGRLRPGGLGNISGGYDLPQLGLSFSWCRMFCSPMRVQKAHLSVAVHDGTVSDFRRPIASARACACPC
eukprot:9000389-Lingulodinium_polyedra.AAC.1